MVSHPLSKAVRDLHSKSCSCGEYHHQSPDSCRSCRCCNNGASTDGSQRHKRHPSDALNFIRPSVIIKRRTLRYLTMMVLCCSFFIKLLLEKKFALQYRLIEALVANFMKFVEEPKIMPVIWHHSLLAFAQRYKNALLKEDIDKLINLLEAQNHHEVTPEIRRELFHSRNHSGKEDAIHSCMSLFNRPVTEDIFDIPEVPMEDD